MRKLLVIASFVFTVLLSSCDNPDFASYRFYERQVLFHVEGNLFVISDIEKEMLRIAENYCKEITLSHVEYTLSDKNTETLIFSYMSINDDRTTLVTLEVDIFKRSVTKVIYEDGHSKRVSSFGHFVEQTNFDAKEILAETMATLSESGVNLDKISHVKVIFINKSVRVNTYDVWSRLINGYDYLK